MKANCIICGKEFEKLRTAKTCGKECWLKRKRKHKRESKRRYHVAHPEKQREYKRRHRATYPEKKRAENHRYAAKNPDRKREYNRNCKNIFSDARKLGSHPFFELGHRLIELRSTIEAES